MKNSIRIGGIGAPWIHGHYGDERRFEIGASEPLAVVEYRSNLIDCRKDSVKMRCR